MTALADAGVSVETVDANHLRLRSGRQSQVVRLHRLSVLTPSRVPPSPAEAGLLVAPTATRKALATATDKNWNIATDAGFFRLQIGGRIIESRPRGEVKARRQPGPPSWAMFTLGRRILTGPPMTGVALASASGASQSRTSRLVTRLVTKGLIERSAGGYRPVDWRAFLDWWVSAYPGPGGTVSYWASAASATDQARAAALALGKNRVAISADPAADILAPWRRPTLTVAYAERGAPLKGHGFVAVGGAGEATLILRAPRDPGVWLPSPWRVEDLPLADPIQIVWDVANSPGADRAQAVDRLVEALRHRHLRDWQEASVRSPQ